MPTLKGNLILKQEGKRVGERDLEAPVRVSITTPSGDIFQWTGLSLVLQPNGTILIPLPDQEPMR